MKSFGFGNEEAFLNWMAFWFAIHDLGKFSEAFQSQRADLFSLMRGHEPNATKPYRVLHDTLGLLVWNDVVAELVINAESYGANTEDYLDGANAWARAVTGHHGQPPEEVGYWGQHFDVTYDGEAIREFVIAMKGQFLGQARIAIAAEPFWRSSQRMSWWIAGLTFAPIPW